MSGAVECQPLDIRQPVHKGHTQVVDTPTPVHNSNIANLDVGDSDLNSIGGNSSEFLTNDSEGN